MPEPIRFTDEQKKAYRAAYAPTATNDQAELFFTECERRALIPGVHVIFQLRKATEFSTQLQRSVDVQKVTLISTINALRLIAERSGKFRGYGKFTYYYPDEEQPGGPPTVTSFIPLGRIPHAVSVELFREGWAQPVFSVARYDACVQLKADKTPTAMWFKRGEEQLAKCAEANGLRMVAPEECGGLYIEEEMGQAAPEPEQQQEPAPAGHCVTEKPAPVVIPQPTVAPAVNQAAAPIQTSPIAEVAANSAKAWETVKAPDAPALVHQSRGAVPPTPRPPAAAKAAPPAPTARPVTQPPAPAHVAAPAPTPAAAGPIPNRVPIVQEPAKESPSELAEFADRVARDNDPAPAPTPEPGKFVATDEDLPENLQPPKTNPLAKSPDGGAALAASLLAPVAQTEPTAAPAPADGTQAANATEYQSFMNRAAKIVRDKLEKDAKVKGAGALVKDYLLKKSFQQKLNKISAVVFEALISELEKATPEEAARLVKGQ